MLPMRPAMLCMATTIDFSDPAFLENAYDTYARMRAEGPVSHVQFARGEPANEEERLLDDVPAVLVLQSEGVSGAEAVDVDVRDPLGVYQRIGRLASADVNEYAAVIAEMKRRTGMHVGCLARISGKGPSAHYTRPHYSALVYLPDASEWRNWEF